MMTDQQTRSEILATLAATWAAAPHLRFCQLVEDVVGQQDAFYMRDETFLHKLNEFHDLALKTNGGAK